MAQSAAKFSPEDLKTLTENEVTSCLALLGKEKLTIEQAEILWRHVLKVIIVSYEFALHSKY